MESWYLIYFIDGDAIGPCRMQPEMSKKPHGEVICELHAVFSSIFLIYQVLDFSGNM